MADRYRTLDYGQERRLKRREKKFNSLIKKKQQRMHDDLEDTRQERVASLQERVASLQESICTSP